MRKSQALEFGSAACGAGFFWVKLGSYSTAKRPLTLSRRIPDLVSTIIDIATRVTVAPVGAHDRHND
jgi:hypothetical protein